MNYLSGAFRYVAGADADKQDEVHRLVERIKSSSLAQDRRGAIIQLTQIAKESSRRQAEIGEIGLKVFYAVLDQDKNYDGNLRAIIDLLIAICASAETDAPGKESSRKASPTAESVESNDAMLQAKREREALDVASTNIDMFLGLPDAISLVLEHLSHDDFHIRCTTLELLTAMGANSRQTLQAAILDAVQGVNSICDLLDDPQQVVRSSTVLLLSVLCTESPEVSKIVAFSGVPDKLFDMVQVVNPKPANMPGVEVEDDVDDNLEAAIVIQDVLELLGSVINCSGTTRTALRELSFIGRIVAMLSQVVRGSGFNSDSAAQQLNTGSLKLALLKQNSRNTLLCLSNISGLLQGDPVEAKQMTDVLATTDVFGQLQSLAFLDYMDTDGKELAANKEIANIRLAALRTMATLVKEHSDFRILYFSKLCPSSLIETATPQICALHTMLHDRSAALRLASYLSLRESFIIDSATGLPSPALVNALTGSSSLMSLVQTASADLEVDDEDEDEISIPPKYLAILAEALKDALTLYPKSSDEAAVYYSSSLLSWTILRVPGARERLLASYAHNAGNSLFPQVMRVLGNAQRQQAPAPVRIGLLSLICAWLYNSPSTVSAFLSSAMHLPMVIEIIDIGTGADEPASVHMKGLAAIILGICLEAADGDAVTSGEGGFISGGRGPSMVIPRGTISDVIRNHIGITAFTARLDDVKATRQFSSALNGESLWKLSSELSTTESSGLFISETGAVGHGEWYDSELVTVMEDVYTEVAARAIELLSTRNDTQDSSEHVTISRDKQQGYSSKQGGEVGPSRTMEMLLADSAKDEVLNTYKEIIRGQDEKIESLEKALRGSGAPMSTNGTGADPSGEEHEPNRVLEHMLEDKAASLPNGTHRPEPNGHSSGHDAALAEEVYRGKELTAAVSYLEEQLQTQKEESLRLLDDLDSARRQQEDWRRRAEETSQLMDQERQAKEKAGAEIKKLAQTIETMKNSSEVQGDEMAASNRRVADLEERCAELAEMRKRTEEEVINLRGEVTLRAEQSIEVSGKLYEAEEKNAILEEQREKLSAELASAAAKSSGTAQMERSIDPSTLMEIESLRADLAASKDLNTRLEESVRRLEEVAQGREKTDAINSELEAELGDTRASNVDLSAQCVSLTNALEVLKKESVPRADVLLLENEIKSSKSVIATLREDTAGLQETVKTLQHAEATARGELQSSQKELDISKQSLSGLREDHAELKDLYERLQNSEKIACAEVAAAREELGMSNKSLSQVRDENAKLKESVQSLEAAAALSATRNLNVSVPKRPRHSDAISSVSESFDSYSEVGRHLGTGLLRVVSKPAGTQTEEDGVVAASSASDANKIEELKLALTEASTVAKRSCAELALAETALHELSSERQVVESQISTLQNDIHRLNAELTATKTEHLNRERELAVEKQREVEEKEAAAAFAYQQEVDVLTSKVALVENKYSGLQRTKEELELKKEELESTVLEMRASEEKLREDNRQALKLLGNQHRKDTSETEDFCNSLHVDFMALLRKERLHSNMLREAVTLKTEELGGIAAQLCCSQAALQVNESALRAELGHSSRLIEDLESKQHTVDALEKSLDKMTLSSENHEQDQSSSEAMESRVSMLEEDLKASQQKLNQQRDEYESRLRVSEQEAKLASETVEATKRMFQASEASASASAEKAKAVLGVVRTELSSVRAEVDKKTKVIANLSEAKDDLERELGASVGNLNSKLAEAEKNVIVVTKEKRHVECSVQKLNVEILEVSKALTDSVEKAEHLSSKLKDEEKAMIDLERKLEVAVKSGAEAAEELSGKRRLLGAKSAECKKLEQNLAQEKSARVSLESELRKMALERDTLVNEKSKVEQGLRKAQAELQSTEEKLVSVRQECTGLRAWSAELETKATELESAASKFQLVENNLNESLSARKEAAGKIKKLSEELQSVQSELSIASAASRSATRRQTEVVEEVVSLRKRISELEGRLRSTRDQHTQRLREVEQSRLSTSKRNAELEADLAIKERELAEKANLADQLDASESERAELNRVNQNLRERADAAEAQLEEMRQSAESLRNELSNGDALNDLKAEHEELLVCLAEMDAECALLKEQLGRS